MTLRECSAKPDKRRAVIFYDRTTEWKAGGNGKSLVAKSFRHLKPIHLVDMKHEKKGDSRFLFSGFTPDRRICVLSDTSRDLDFENLYVLVSDGFTIEDKGEKKYVLSEEHSPKLVLTTNFEISNQDRSDHRRQFHVPVGTFYGTLLDRTGKTPTDVHGGLLLDRHSWTDQDWSDFYATCLHCLQEFLSHGLVPFDDSVLADRQMLKAVGGREDLLSDLTHFIEGIVQGPGECSRDEVLKVFESPDYEHLGWKNQYKVKCFRKVAAGLGYQINPGRERLQKVVNGVTEDWYRLVLPVQPTDPLKGLQDDLSGPTDVTDFM